MFLFEFELLVCSLFTSEENIWLVTYWLLLPRMPSLFMTTLIQFTGHKLVAPWAYMSMGSTHGRVFVTFKLIYIFLFYF